MTSNKEQWEREDYNEAMRQEDHARNGDIDDSMISVGGLAHDMGFDVGLPHDSFKCTCADCRRYNETLDVLKTQTFKLSEVQRIARRLDEFYMSQEMPIVAERFRHLADIAGGA